MPCRRGAMGAMSLPPFHLLASFGTLVLFVAKWAGVIFLRRSAAKLPWGLMVAGVLINTLASILSLCSPLLGRSLFYSHDAYQWLALASHFGNVTFAVGFALYGLAVARASQRQGELEQLVTAMSEEMDRLRGESSPR